MKATENGLEDVNVSLLGAVVEHRLAVLVWKVKSSMEDAQTLAHPDWAKRPVLFYSR